MGKGIVSGNGADPLDEWKTRLTWFGSEVLTRDLRMLLSGQRVHSADGELEISSRTLADGSGAIVLTIRRATAPYVADIVVVPLLDDANAKDRDARSPIPAPDQWLAVVQDGVDWELFNCRVATLKSRKN